MDFLRITPKNGGTILPEYPSFNLSAGEASLSRPRLQNGVGDPVTLFQRLELP